MKKLTLSTLLFVLLFQMNCSEFVSNTQLSSWQTDYYKATQEKLDVQRNIPIDLIEVAKVNRKIKDLLDKICSVDPGFSLQCPEPIFF